jgi:dissimilatory sulfite reductase (desulfoviridin) alpha/beta subunit
MKRRTWSEDSIKDVLRMTRPGKCVVATCDTVEEAIRFRSAIYNYLRAKSIATQLHIKVSGCDVIVTINIAPPRTPSLSISAG